MKLRLFAAAVTLMAAVSCDVYSAPKPGLLSVLGSAVPGVDHADRGAPAQMQGLALKWSGAELGYCNINTSAAIDPLIASGCEIAAYVHRGTSTSTGQWLYGKGIRKLIFENEPDGNLADYMSVLPTAYSIMHSLGPGVSVIAGNCFGSGAYSYLYQNGFKNCSDMVGYHNYSDDPATGVDIGSVVSVHNTMNSYGDGSKKIYLGEGWGPKRELRTCPRVSPDVQPTIAEIQQLKDFVVNGWRNLTTAAGGYDPNWVYGALFFTLSDNWGFDYAHFYNGGIIDLYGNPKDNLLLLFPGNKLTLRNCGFEHFNPGKPQGAAPFWGTRAGTSVSCYALDASIRRAGQRSQRVEVSGTTQAHVTQTTENGSVTVGQQYTFAARVRTQGVSAGAYAGARLGIQFLSSTGSATSSTAWSTGLKVDSDWTHVQVTATAPSGSAKLRVYCELQASDGRAWFDDCGVSNASSPQTGNIEGYVLDSSNNAIAGAAVTVDPGGQSTTTDSTGNFYLSGLGAGAYEVTATKSGWSRKTVSRVAVAPGRTSIAGLHLRHNGSDAPGSVSVSSPGISRMLRISWDPPATGADYYRVYQSTDPDYIGLRIADNVTSTVVWDQNLTDYQTYYYVVRRVLGGVESSNVDNYSGVPTGGPSSIAYDVSADPDWGNWTTQHGQTFVATNTGSLTGATCVLATAGEPRARTMTFSIRKGGPTGAQIGPDRTVVCYSDEIGTALWSGGEVPVIQGQTYYLSLVASSSTAIYRTKQDVYSGGRYYKDGVPFSSNVDLWSTITITEDQAPDALDVSAANTGSGQVTLTWLTSAPTTGQVEYGPTASYGSLTELDSSLLESHSAVLTGLSPGGYHFRVRGVRPSSPECISLDYTFSVPPSAASVAEAKEAADGDWVGFGGIVSGKLEGFVYVQDVDRCSGIRVLHAGEGLAEGQSVYVTGTLATSADGERCIRGAAVAPAPG